MKKALKLRFILAFIGLALASAPVFAQSVINGSLDMEDPTFNRPRASAPCALSGATNVYYDTYPINHAGGTLNISMRGFSSGGGTLTDPYLVLYTAPFNPADPCANWIAGNDDSGEGLDALLALSLPAGNYIIVATSYANGLSGSYTLSWISTSGIPTLNLWSIMLLAGLLALIGRWRRRLTK